MFRIFLTATLFVFLQKSASAQPETLVTNHITWEKASRNAAQSMPCGGGDIGLNVWVEDGDLLCYMARSGSFDENNSLLKAGRMRIRLKPNPFTSDTFRQELVLEDGHVRISGTANGVSAAVIFWVDVNRPVIHVDLHASKPVVATATYENWRYKDRPLSNLETRGTSWKWAPPQPVFTYKDSVVFDKNDILFWHRNNDQPSLFDSTVNQQGLQSLRDSLYNPLKHRTFGGMVRATNMQAAGTQTGKYCNTDFMGWKLESIAPERVHQIEIILHTSQDELMNNWQAGLQNTAAEAARNRNNARLATTTWWNNFWQRSYVFIDPDNADTASKAWQAGRNYQLFRYMLGCNANSAWPTKFNGGLFTYDPVFTDTANRGTPDHRNWGGGIHTAQNQRLVYWPMLKSGDAALMQPQFDFYLRLLKNAELRSHFYWNHAGANFTEQLENFGLPNYTEYGTKRPAGYDKGMEYNAWLEYEWDTVLEFCSMMLQSGTYTNKDIAVYIPFIESCLDFFSEHYQYLAKQRSAKALDGNGKLVIYPGSAAETYKLAYNPSSTIAALKTVTEQLLQAGKKSLTAAQKNKLATLLERLPALPFRTMNGYPTIAPASIWARINNTESPQLYPVFPWRLYGVGKPGLDTAINTWRHDTDVVKFKSAVGWRQHNIFAACLGLTSEAFALNVQKMQNSGRRFPAFWGPGFDWTPDHNWGGSGMVGIQEMLLQTNNDKIYLFPAWPKNTDVHFKLYAPGQTTVEAVLKKGKLEKLEVIPASRSKDVVNMLQ